MYFTLVMLIEAHEKRSPSCSSQSSSVRIGCSAPSASAVAIARSARSRRSWAVSGAPDGETGLAASHAESGISAAAGGDWAVDAVLAGASAFAGTALAGRCAAGVLVMGGRAGDNAAILTRGPARAVAAGRRERDGDTL